jgi:tetratricopeptide (TPR) repeat protein
MLFTSTGMIERNLDMGIDRIHQQAQKLERAGSDALAKQDYQTAANDFRKAAEKLRDAGDFDKSSFDFQRAGDALEGEGGLKQKAGDFKGAKTAFEGAATNLEDAGADALKTRSSTRHSTAEGYYGAAGTDRVHAGVYAQETHKKEEAAKNYRQGQADLQLAGDEATKQGRNDTALDYYDKAEKAGKAADEVSGKPKSGH